MAKVKEIYLNHDEKTGESVFRLQYRGEVFEGEAKCHEQDIEFRSKLTGLEIARSRAFKKYLLFRKKEVSIRLKTLKGVLKNLSTSKDFDKFSGYGKKLVNSIVEADSLRATLAFQIAEIDAHLKRVLNQKDDFYEKIRKLRKDGNKPRFIDLTKR